MHPLDIARFVRDTQAWRPRNARLLLEHTFGRERRGLSVNGDDDRIRAAAAWIASAQDAMSDGGIAGRYHIATGWTSSYPETTGYLLPTMLQLAREPGLASFEDRARRAVNFLLALQLDSGAFPGGEVHENTTKPSIFNSAQIVNGLIAWHQHTGDARVLEAATRAGDWLAAMLDDDGAWRKHTYNDLPVTYAAHASCWLAELGAHTGNQKYLDAARRHLEWVLTFADPATGWIDRAGFNPKHHEDRSGHTHTIAYTVWGVLFTSEILAHARGIAAAEQAAWGIARRLELSRWLPGEINSKWKGVANYACVTGTAQMALIWMRIHERTGDLRFANAALKGIDLVKRAQAMSTTDPGLYGGIPGSDPVWGGYIHLAYPNWAAKFFVDALFAKRRMLARIDAAPSPMVAWRPPPVLQDAPRARGPVPMDARRVVILASADSTKVAHMLEAWKVWGFRPAAVLIESRPEPGAVERAAARMRSDGVGALFKAVARRVTPMASTPAVGAEHVVQFPAAREACARAGVTVVEVASLDSEAAVTALKQLKPDLAVNAGGSILRAPLLAVPTIGTVNPHMGILPRYRGVNVAEWSTLEGTPVGCTVHFVDTGIDTGPVLAIRAVSTAGARTVEALRAAVADEQIALLGDVVAALIERGAGAFAPYVQSPGEGHQYFTIHPELRERVGRKLNAT